MSYPVQAEGLVNMIYHLSVWSNFNSLLNSQWITFPAQLCLLFSMIDSGFCIYHLSVWSSFNLLHSSQCITFPTYTSNIISFTHLKLMTPLLLLLLEVAVIVVVVVVVSLVLVWFGLVLWHINHCRLFDAKSIFIHINSSVSNNSVMYKYIFLFIHC